MNQHDHHLLLKLALDNIQGFLKKNYRDLYEMAVACCMYPDEYAVSLLENKKGDWRKYFPKSVNKRFAGKALPDIDFYVKNIIHSLKQDDLRNAFCFIGVFSHYIGDFAQPAHWYETERYELLPPPDGIIRNSHVLIESLNSSLIEFDYVPHIVAAGPEEMIFKLESRFERLKKLTVSKIVPILESLYAGNEKSAKRHYDRVMSNAVELLADFCLTVIKLGRGEVSENDLQECSECRLSKIIASRYDVEGVYGSRPFSGPFILDGTNEKICLQLRRDKGQTIDDGICAIPHALPASGRPMWSWIEYDLPVRVYSGFEVFAGLCEHVSPQAECRFEISGDNQILFQSDMITVGVPAVKISVDVRQIHSLRLTVYTDGSTDKLAFPVWGGGRLIK